MEFIRHSPRSWRPRHYRDDTLLINVLRTAFVVAARNSHLGGPSRLLWRLGVRAPSAPDGWEAAFLGFNLLYHNPSSGFETESYHDANFVVTGGNTGCRDDNLRCRQWRLSLHCNVTFTITHLLVRELPWCQLWRHWRHDDNLRCPQWR